MKIDLSNFSDRYTVRRIEKDDLSIVYDLCRKNSLYYDYCPPAVTEQSIVDDMNALPPNKSSDDKYYLGYFDGKQLIALMDLIMQYPDDTTAFIGFFMTDVSVQHAGVGSRIIDDLCSCLKNINISKVRLGWAKGNPQSEHFWRKNSFHDIGTTYNTPNYTVVVAERVL